MNSPTRFVSNFSVMDKDRVADRIIDTTTMVAICEIDTAVSDFMKKKNFEGVGGSR